MAELNIEKMAHIVADKAIQELRDKGVFVAYWIPVTEWLPKACDTYLVTVTYKGEVLAVDAACFGPDCHYIDDMWATYNDWIEDDPELYHITAWMELPDAYEGGMTNGK